MSLWKYSFELVTRELELANKKKQALTELFETKRISPSTHQYLKAELDQAMKDLQTHLKSLTDKMNARSQELDRQVRTLELFLASTELHHAAGDLRDESYEAQTKAIQLGLEITKQELEEIKTSLSRTISEPKAPSISQPAEMSEPVAETLSEQTSTEGEPQLIAVSE